MGEDFKEGIVYVVDDDDFIVSEFPCDISFAVDTYYGQRDSRGRRYIIKPFGVDPSPYKRKNKKLFDIIARPQDSSALSTDEQVDC